MWREAAKKIFTTPHFSACNTPSDFAYLSYRETEWSGPEVQGDTEMTAFNIFANGTFWGVWEGETAEEAIQKAADEVGTDGNTEGMTAEEVVAE